jgi:hypothetical protein
VSQSVTHNATSCFRSLWNATECNHFCPRHYRGGFDSHMAHQLKGSTPKFGEGVWGLICFLESSPNRMPGAPGSGPGGVRRGRRQALHLVRTPFGIGQAELTQPGNHIARDKVVLAAPAKMSGSCALTPYIRAAVLSRNLAQPINIALGQSARLSLAPPWCDSKSAASASSGSTPRPAVRRLFFNEDAGSAASVPDYRRASSSGVASS